MNALFSLTDFSDLFTSVEVSAGCLHRAFEDLLVFAGLLVSAVLQVPAGHLVSVHLQVPAGLLGHLCELLEDEGDGEKPHVDLYPFVAPIKSFLPPSL